MQSILVCNDLTVEERPGSYTLIVSCGFWSVSLPRGTVGWSIVCVCYISTTTELSPKNRQQQKPVGSLT